MEDIPPIELTLLCDDFLKSCLPIQEQFLYCYRGGSCVQDGGFAKFLEDRPDVLEACIQRIRVSEKRWKYPTKKYLAFWSELSYDTEQMKCLCEKISDAIRWESLSGASDQELKEFFKNFSSKTCIVDEEKDIENLRILLVEASFRHILAEEAGEILRKEAEEVFNDKSKFRICLSAL